MQRKRIGDFLVYLMVRVLICIVQAMRVETSRKLARALAWLLNDVIRIRAAVVALNRLRMMLTPE